jgi:hypothetical protein
MSEDYRRQWPLFCEYMNSGEPELVQVKHGSEFSLENDVLRCIDWTLNKPMLTGTPVGNVRVSIAAVAVACVVLCCVCVWALFWADF